MQLTMALLLSSALSINAYVLPGPAMAPVRTNVVMRHQYEGDSPSYTACPQTTYEEATRDG